MTRRTATRDKAGKSLRRTTKTPSSADLQKLLNEQARELAETRSQLSEALGQQTATSEVLKVISSSSGNLQPVFNSMLQKATRICDASFGNMSLYDGSVFRHVALLSAPAAWAERQQRDPVVPRTARVLYGLVHTKQVIHVEDLAVEDPDTPLAKMAGARTVLIVPMLKADQLIGAIGIYRREVRSFTNKQIELLTNFAAQAVIAIENARLLSELRQRTDDLSEALDQQTATSEVLGVIASSPGIQEPVFKAMLENAIRICGAKFGNMYLFEGDEAHIAAACNTPQGLIEARRRAPHRTDSKTPTSRAGQTKQVVHVADLMTDDAYVERDPAAVTAVELGGVRTLLVVPMLKNQAPIGTINIYRQEVRPFSHKQIELVQNFAAQAVIAIENTRLLNELRQRTDDLTESLEQQTATAEVLKVISSSPGDLDPVFNSILENATRICGATFGNLLLFDGNVFRHVALHNAPQAWAELQRRDPIPPRGALLYRIVETKQAIHIADVTAETPDVPIAKLARARILLIVPMLKDDMLIGAIGIYRQEVQPFTDKQIALLTNFAAQAVIAIENTRLLNELRESLQRQTATSDVLSVISSSPGELEPVFDAMLANAVRLCEAKFGMLMRYDAGNVYPVAWHNVPQALTDHLRQLGPFPPPKGTALDRALATKEVIHTIDQASVPIQSPSGRLAGARSHIVVPMLKENELIGAVIIYRTEVRPFTDKQIDLVKNFAAQAVIAIENTRLLSELRESLAQQTATGEVLKVISSSPGDLTPVFDVLLANATRMCGAKFGALSLRDGDVFRGIAMIGAPAAFAEARTRDPIIRPTPGHNLERLVLTKDVVHIPDLAADKEAAPVPYTLAGARAALNVPLLKDDELIGSLLIYRQEKGPFTDKQIELVQNFAAQAVIAIENTRLLNELRESLQQQTATADVLKVISRSTFDLQTVLDTLVASAARLCRADRSSIRLLKDGLYHHVASFGYLPEHDARMRREARKPGDGSISGRIALDSKIVRIIDAQADSDAQLANWSRSGDVRTVLAVPLMREGAPIGALLLFRNIVEAFTDKQIELVQTFADQAVIAIENVRLFDEVQARTEDLAESLQQQTATADVLKVISSSPGELEPVFNALLENATRICGAKFGTLFRCDDNVVHLAAQFGTPPALVEFQQKRGPFRPDAKSTGVLSRVIRTKAIVHSPDSAADPNPGMVTTLGGARSIVGVPMFKDAALIGAIVIYREEVQPFTEKQIELVQNFAAQAVIAIENTRLLGELRESLQQQTATADVLKVISRSTFDLQAVLDTLVELAARLCRADRTAIRIAKDGLYHHATDYGFSPEVSERMMRDPVEPSDWTMVGRVLAAGNAVHIIDAQADLNERMARMAAMSRTRSFLGVPLLREGFAIGVLLLQRSAVQPFTDKEIELATTFADQASIAIKNVQLFDEIQDKSRQLAEASQHKSQFLANMSHELRTPLNAILGYSELIADGIYGAPPEKMGTVLKRVESNGRHLLGLINAVLDLSKIEAGQFTLDLADYSLQNVAQTVYNAVESLAVDKNLVFKTEVQSDLPLAHGDERRLTQVLLNLVGNAIKFTDAGEVVIKAEISNGAFYVLVRDTGPGISSVDQAKLFQEFHQADNSITKKKGGTGLGLAISKRIIEMHGGRIWVELHPGKGSTFAFTLPVIAQKQVTNDEQMHSGGRGPAG